MLTGSNGRARASAPDAEAIEVHDLAVRYRVPRERVTSLKEFAIRWLQRRVAHDELWGLRGVNLTVPRGEILGVVGRNGAGKSTLLKVLARVLHPTEGRVVVRGQVAPLLELGAGFHDELTGRENVHLYGALLGYDRGEIERRFEAIVDFAELWDFIDAPLRVYSSGMVSRLGFAVATADYADVFLIDEVLAVGDSAFQEKCQRRLQVYRDRGSTAVLVSHNPGTIAQICDRVVWLEAGRIAACGEPERVLRAYESGQAAALAQGADRDSGGAPVGVADAA